MTVVESASRAHDRDVQVLRRDHEREDAERRAEVRKLIAGESAAVAEMLETVAEIPYPGRPKISCRALNSTITEADLLLPETSVIQPKSATLLASGKPSYKEKNQKRINEEYALFAVGLAFRVASEIMLRVPTTRIVVVRGSRSQTDPSTGKDFLAGLFRIQFDYAKLEPLTMAGIDPVEALVHFDHQVEFDRFGAFVPSNIG